jgi:hypothetical protein
VKELYDNGVGRSKMGVRTNVHDEDLSGRPSVVSDDYFQNTDQTICERRRFTISELSCEYPQISRTIL